MRIGTKGGQWTTFGLWSAVLCCGGQDSGSLQEMAGWFLCHWDGVLSYQQWQPGELIASQTSGSLIFSPVFFFPLVLCCPRILYLASYPLFFLRPSSCPAFVPSPFYPMVSVVYVDLLHCFALSLSFTALRPIFIAPRQPFFQHLCGTFIPEPNFKDKRPRNNSTTNE